MEKKNLVQVGEFLGSMFAFNNSLKLYHWHVTGPGSYAEHMALDQALEDLVGMLDEIVETTYALAGDIDVVIPQTKIPSDIVAHAEKFYQEVESKRELFPESFSQGIFDGYQQAVQQMLYRLKRLK